MGKFIDLTGQKFGRLTVIERRPNRGKSTMWRCACSCGSEKIVASGHLHSGHTKSCGCADLDRKTKHGLSRDPLHKTWRAMIDRCTNSKSQFFQHYGGRGISVCSQWFSFDVFKKDVEQGYQPGLQLDRINNNGNYEPQNVRWATRTTNVRNSRATKLNEQDAGAIKSLLNMGQRQNRIAQMFDVSEAAIKKINDKKTWKEVCPLW